jgi:DNA polymerase III delta prime subunit
LQSRCQTIQLTPPINLIVKRIKYILNNENVLLRDDDKNKLILLIKKHFPDIRKTINEVQKYCINGVLDIPDLSNVDGFVNKIITFILKNKILELRKTIIQNEHDFKGDYVFLMKNLFDHICDVNVQGIDDFQKKNILLNIGEFMYRSSFVADQEINFYCLLIANNPIINQK